MLTQNGLKPVQYCFKVVQNSFAVVQNLFQLVQNSLRVGQNSFRFVQNLSKLVQNSFVVVQNLSKLSQNSFEVVQCSSTRNPTATSSMKSVMLNLYQYVKVLETKDIIARVDIVEVLFSNLSQSPFHFRPNNSSLLTAPEMSQTT